MKAVVVSRFGGPEVLQYVDIDLPQVGRGQVRVEVRAIGVHAADAMWREGTYPYALPRPPFVPGQIATGVVAEIGSGVEGLTIGDPVHVLHLPGGAYAEQIVAPRDDIIRLPDGIDLQAAACITDYIATWAFFQDGFTGHEAKSVFMPNSTGGSGMANIQCAKQMGMQVIASGSSEEGCRRLIEWGADHAINHKTGDVIAEVLSATAGRGVDAVLDHVAGPAFSDHFALLAPDGMIFIMNTLAGAPRENPFMQMRLHPDRCWKIRSWSTHVYDRHAARRQELTRQVIDLMVTGRFRPTGINRQLLAEAGLVHALRGERKLIGKTILVP